LQSKNFPPDKRYPGHRCRYGKYGPRSGYGFLRTACQPIRIENFEKPYNNTQYIQLPLDFEHNTQYRTNYQRRNDILHHLENKDKTNHSIPFERKCSGGVYTTK
jgi:hypothetical protein